MSNKLHQTGDFGENNSIQEPALKPDSPAVID